MSMSAEDLLATYRSQVAPTSPSAATTVSGPRLLPPSKPAVYEGNTKKKKDDGGGILDNLVFSPFGFVANAVTSIPKYVLAGAKTGSSISQPALTGLKLGQEFRKGQSLGLSGLDLAYYTTSKELPLATQVAQNVIQTGGNVAELGTLGKFDVGESGVNYANAWRSGDLGAVILNDLGNIVLVGRGVGAGNVIGRGGVAISKAGAPRLGRVVAGTGRFVEEPIGSTLRTAARVAEPLAANLGRPILSERFGRVSQAGIETGEGPIRQGLIETSDAIITRATSRLARVNEKIAEINRQIEETPSDAGRLAAERIILEKKQQGLTRLTGLVRNIRLFTRQRQIQEEQRRASFVSEGLRLQQQGPSVEFDGAPKGPLPEFAEKVANLIMTGRLDAVVRELKAGVPFERIMESINPSGIGPDLARAGYAFTAEDLQRAIEYADGALSEFDRLSVDAVVNFYRRWSDEFTASQLSGEYRLGGPMPKTYTQRFPIVEFFFNEAELGRFPRIVLDRMLSYLDVKTIELVISKLDEDTLAENNIRATADNPISAFKQLYEVPKGSDLEGLAQQLFEALEPELMQQFPEIMRNPMIYAAPMRPEMMLEGRLLRSAKATDIRTVLTGLNGLIEQYGDILGKGTVASLIANLENIVGTPLENTPGAYRQVMNQLAGIRRAIAERIVKLQERTGELTAEQRQLTTDLIDAEARLGAAEATLRTVATTYDAIRPIPDEAQANAQEAVRVAQSKLSTVQAAIDEYRRNQAELQLQEDPRQQLVDEIDKAVREVGDVEANGTLENLIMEFRYRQEEVEAGNPDPISGDAGYTAKSPEAKIRKRQMISEAADRAGQAIFYFDEMQPAEKLSWYSWTVQAFPGHDASYKSMMARYLGTMYGPDVVRMALREFQKTYVVKRGEWYKFVKNGGSTAEDFIHQSVGKEFADRFESDAAKLEKGGLDRELALRWGAFIQAVIDERNAKKMTLAEVAEILNRETTQELSSNLPLPVLARAIAYATNPNLLTADLRLRDRYVSEMENGIPHEGATPRLIPIPKGLEQDVTQAQRTVDKQQAELNRLRDRSVAEQQKELKAQLKGVGKIVVEGEQATPTGALLKGARARIENEIQQYVNKLENRRIKLEEVKARHAAEQALLDQTVDIAQQASAVEQYLQRPVGAQLFNETTTPQYLPTGLPASARPGSRVRTELSGEGAAPQVKAFSEQMRTSDVMPLTLKTTIQRINELLNVTGRNKIIDDIVLNPDFARRAGTFVTPEQMVQIYESARAEVEAQPQRRTPAEIATETEKLASVKLSRIIKDAGYEPISRITIDPETGAHEALGDLLRTVRDDEVSINTVVMRKGVRERITQQFKVKDASETPEGFAVYVEKIARATGKWKGVVLPFRISWQTGDAVSNVLNAWVRGDVPPQQLVDRIREVDKVLSDQGKRLEVLSGSVEDPLIATLIAYGVHTRGLRDSEVQQMRGVGDPRQAIPDYQFKRFFPKFREKSFRFNEYQNTLARVATAIEKLEAELAQRGRTIDEVTLPNVRRDPVLRASVEKVVAETNDALGAFSELSPFEKNVMRNIYPFWSWIRYINKAAVQLAIDSPDRVLFTIALGALTMDDEQSGLFPFLEGRVPLLGYYFDLSFLNPYQDAILFSSNPARALLDQATSISPVINFPFQVAAATGTYLGDGRQFPLLPNISRPSYLEGSKAASTRTFGDFVGELGYIGLQNFGGPFRSTLTMLPSDFENIPAPIRTQLLSRFPGMEQAYGAIFPDGRIRGTDVAIGNVQRFPQGSKRTTGRYSVERLGPVASRISALLGVVGIPRPLIEEDVALQQAKLQSLADLDAQRRREQERRLSRINP